MPYRRRRSGPRLGLWLACLGGVALLVVVGSYAVGSRPLFAVPVGVPLVVAQPDAPSARTLRQIAEKVAAQVSIRTYEAPVLEVE